MFLTTALHGALDCCIVAACAAPVSRLRALHNQASPLASMHVLRADTPLLLAWRLPRRRPAPTRTCRPALAATAARAGRGTQYSGPLP